MLEIPLQPDSLPETPSLSLPLSYSHVPRSEGWERQPTASSRCLKIKATKLPKLGRNAKYADDGQRYVNVMCNHCFLSPPWTSGGYEDRVQVDPARLCSPPHTFPTNPRESEPFGFIQQNVTPKIRPTKRCNIYSTIRSLDIRGCSTVSPVRFQRALAALSNRHQAVTELFHTALLAAEKRSPPIASSARTELLMTAGLNLGTSRLGPG